MYFLTDQKLQINSQAILIDGEFTHAAKSQRYKLGDDITIQDKNNNRFLCTVIEISKKSLTANVTKQLPAPATLKQRITLYVSAISQTAMEEVITHTTELGVTSIVIFNSNYSQNTHSNSQKKLERYNKLAQESCKQSNRQIPPTISFSTIENLPNLANKHDVVFLGEQNSTNKIELSNNHSDIAVVIGPEGGFSNADLKILCELNNLQKITLSNNILKAETACICAISQILINL